MEKIRPIAVRIKVADPALAEAHKLLYNEGASNVRLEHFLHNSSVFNTSRRGVLFLFPLHSS